MTDKEFREKLNQTCQAVHDLTRDTEIGSIIILVRKTNDKMIEYTLKDEDFMVAYASNIYPNKALLFFAERALKMMKERRELNESF